MLINIWFVSYSWKSIFIINVQKSYMKFKAPSAQHLFLSTVLFTDEAHFDTYSNVNIHNQHLLAEENPHGAFHSRHYQHYCVGRYSLWLVNPHILPCWLSGNNYHNFLLHDLLRLMEDAPLAVLARMRYVHGGAPAHFSCAVKDVLSIYHDWWISRGGPTAWSPPHHIWILWILTYGNA